MFFRCEPHQRSFWESFLAKCNGEAHWYEPIAAVGGPSVCWCVDSRSSDYRTVMSLLENHGIHWSERRENRWTASELRSSEQLYFSLGTREVDTGRPTRPEQFDFSSACRRCGVGARQIAPLIIHLSRMPRKAIMCQSMDHAYFVTEGAADVLRKARLRGVELLEAVTTGGEPSGWWQLIPRHEMPPFAPETRGVKRGAEKDGWYCPVCRRDNHYHDNKEPTSLVYRRTDADPAKLPDVSETWERFGVSGFAKPGEPFQYSRFASGLILIRPRVFDILRGLKVRGMRLEPVRFV